MITLNVICSLCAFVLAFSVSCQGELKNSTALRHKYRILNNHPPAAENDEIIPVAVVYDKVIDRASRSQKKTIQLDISNTDNQSTNILNNKSTKITATNSKVSAVDENATFTITENKKDNKQLENQSLSTDMKTVPARPVILYDKLSELNKTKVGAPSDAEKTEGEEETKQVHTNTVSTSLNNRNNRPQNSKPTIARSEKPKYRYNRPPITVNEEIIPVAVVYDNTDRSTSHIAKQAYKMETSTGTKPTVEKLAKPTDFRTSLKLASDYKTKVMHEHKQDQQAREPEVITTEDEVKTPQAKQLKLELKIPVSVVYDEDLSSSTDNVQDARKRTRQRDPVVPIIESENKVFAHTGEFAYSYEGGDGTKAFSNGVLKSFDESVAGEAVVGGFSYKDKNGKDFSLTYTADENGYRPIGAHLPTPPPIPPAIARALAYLATKTTPEPVTEAIETN